MASVQFSCSVVSDSLRPHELQHARPEKAMASHSSTLAWKIPWTEEPGGLPSMGLHRVRHDWSDLAAAAAAAGLPVHHQLPEFTQTHVHQVSGAIQPSHPLSSPSPPAPNLSQHQLWCHPAISSSVVPFSSLLQSFPTSGYFQMSQLFASDGQSTGVSASASVLPKNTQDWSPLGWTGWISLQSKGISRVFSNTTVQKHQFFGTQLSSQSNSHIHTWPLEKP